jgi:hypothetical protein
MISAKFEWWFKHSGESILNAIPDVFLPWSKSVVIPAAWKFVDETFTVAIGNPLTIGGGSPAAFPASPRAGRRNVRAELRLARRDLVGVRFGGESLNDAGRPDRVRRHGVPGHGGKRWWKKTAEKD